MGCTLNTAAVVLQIRWKCMKTFASQRTYKILPASDFQSRSKRQFHFRSGWDDILPSAWPAWSSHLDGADGEDDGGDDADGLQRKTPSPFQRIVAPGLDRPARSPPCQPTADPCTEEEDLWIQARAVFAAGVAPSSLWPVKRQPPWEASDKASCFHNLRKCHFIHRPVNRQEANACHGLASRKWK